MTSARFLRTARLLVTHAVLVALFVPIISLALVEWAALQAAMQLRCRFPVPNRTVCFQQDGPGYNPANMYCALEYDCRQTDVEIQGILPPAKYWSMVPYDRYTLPLGSYLSDETIQTESTGRYVAYLTTRPRGRTNEIDVSASPRGLLLIRITLPEDPEEVARQAPIVRPVARE
jgi:hypothetical protein